MAAVVGKLGELLVSQGLINKKQLEEAVRLSSNEGMRLASSLAKLGHVNEKVLATFLSKQYGIPAISLEDVQISKELQKLIPHNLCAKHLLTPLSVENNKITIALADPTNVAAVDDVRFISNMDVSVFIATESDIAALLERSYGGRGAQIEMSNVMMERESEISIEAANKLHDTAIDVDIDIEGQAPVIKVLNKVFVEAIHRGTSDIHVEPYETFCRVRFRIDGALHEVMRLPPNMKAAIPARLKVMAQLDISEKRLPQDGRISVRLDKKKVDIRVSTLPTIFGEKVVMRILDQGSKTPDLKTIGFDDAQLKLFHKAAEQPYGMILVTGPTGSGKSTTLYAALNMLNTPDLNLSTCEDPVEYNMNGINQVNVKSDIGLTFSSALRSLLRQDPDVIMVGEIRDQETAEIAIKAALTGHLVFSTLHTNDAPSTITRLIHMGVEPFLITAALTLVQAQRLIRVVCQKCAVADGSVSREMLIAAEMPPNWIDTARIVRGKGCRSCGNTGYSGRCGIFEVMYMTEKIRETVIKGGNADQLKVVARTQGMATLRMSGLLKLYRGETTLEEVLNNSRPDGDI